MRNVYWISLVAAAAFLGWANLHTDEVPILLGFVLIAGGLLGVINPKRFLISLAVIGAPLPIVETLLHFGLVSAPYPASPLAALPVIALVSYAAALIGVAAGAGVRRMTRSAAIP
jgi:hypothetical protein